MGAKEHSVRRVNDAQPHIVCTLYICQAAVGVNPEQQAKYNTHGWATVVGLYQECDAEVDIVHGFRVAARDITFSTHTSTAVVHEILRRREDVHPL